MTPTFKVIDKRTGREYSEKNINTDGLMEMDLDQMFLGEDGSLVMADDCNQIAYQDCDRFDVVIHGYVSVDRAVDIVHKTMLTFFDNDGEERPMNAKEKLLLSVNKAICNNLKSLKGGKQNA